MVTMSNFHPIVHLNWESLVDATLVWQVMISGIVSTSLHVFTENESRILSKNVTSDCFWRKKQKQNGQMICQKICENSKFVFCERICGEQLIYHPVSYHPLYSLQQSKLVTNKKNLNVLNLKLNWIYDVGKNIYWEFF